MTVFVSGVKTWLAQIVNGAATRVEFYIDNALRWTENFEPYQFNGDPNGRLDTTTLTNGAHTLKVIAYDTSGRTATAILDIDVENAPPAEAWIPDTTENPKLFDQSTTNPVALASQAQAEKVASRCAMVTLAYGGQVLPYKAAMLAKNPNLKFVRYMNPAFTRRADLPSAWYYKAPDGQKVYDAGQVLGGTDHWWLMEPILDAPAQTVTLGEYPGSEPIGSSSCVSFADWVAKTYLALKQRDSNLFDSPWFDDVGGNPDSRDLRKTDGTSVDLNIDELGWYDKTTRAVAQIAAVTAGERFANCLASAQCFYPPGCGGATPLRWFYDNDKVDEGMCEDWARANGASFPDTAYADKSAQMVADVDRPTQFSVIVPAGGNAARWRRFGYGLFLIGNNGKGLFRLTGGGSWDSTDTYYDTDVGVPAAPVSDVTALLSGNVFRRDYRRADSTLVRVYVNATTGSLARDGVTVPAQDAVIVVG